MNIIGDQTDISGATGNAGWVPRNWQSDPLAGGPFSRAYDGPRLANDQERKDLIADRERKRETNIDMARHYGFKPFNQGNTNFCWANAVQMLEEWMRCRQGLPFDPGSPASIACLVTDFRNIGGWCSQALKIICTHGTVPQRLWGANVIDRKLHNAETMAARKKRKVHEYDDIEPKDSRLLIDYLLLNGPVASARMFWRHATLSMDPFVLRDGSFGIREYNSGYGRDSSGITELTGSRIIPDECVGIRSVTA